MPLTVVFFVVANMFHILTGADIGKTKIQEDKMRDHLLQSSNLDTSKSSKNLTVVAWLFCKIKKIKFHIFCYYRLPWAWYHSKYEDLDIACGDSCKGMVSLQM